MSMETVNKRCRDEVFAICKLLGLREGGDFPLQHVRALIEENKKLKGKMKTISELIDKWMEKHEKS